MLVVFFFAMAQVVRHLVRLGMRFLVGLRLMGAQTWRARVVVAFVRRCVQGRLIWACGVLG
jgi:hypothetical protein